MVQIKKSKITDVERLKIEKLRELVKDDLSDYYDTDFNLLRWLQGVDGSIENVAYRLRKHLQMRCRIGKKKYFFLFLLFSYFFSSIIIYIFLKFYNYVRLTHK